MAKRRIRLVLNELNPNHREIINWFDSLIEDGRGKQTSNHLEKAMIEYVRQIKEPKGEKQRSEKKTRKFNQKSQED